MYTLVKDRDYVLKNNLQKEMQKFLTANDRRTFKDKQAVREFMSEVREQMKSLNDTYNRCKPLEIQQWQPNEKEDKIICISEVIYYRFYYGRDQANVIDHLADSVKTTEPKFRKYDAVVMVDCHEATFPENLGKVWSRVISYANILSMFLCNLINK